MYLFLHQSFERTVLDLETLKPLVLSTSVFIWLEAKHLLFLKSFFPDFLRFLAISEMNIPLETLDSISPEELYPELFFISHFHKHM